MSAVLLFALLVFLPSLLAPPHLMDDEDAARAQISRNMLESGDWITPRLNGIRYFEKPPLMYWLVAASMAVFGDNETAARIPTCLIAIVLCWLVARMARDALGEPAGLYAGLTLATCAGLWLFTRILIPDVALTLAVTLAIRAFYKESRTAWLWVAAGLLLKGLIAVVFTLGPVLLYLLVTGLWRSRKLPFAGIAIATALAAPWYIAASLRNPPYLNFAMHSTPGIYRGFFWYHLFNEQILRFMGRRYPHDFSNIPIPWFWLLHLAWLFPWSVFLFRSSPASRLRTLALCWIGVVMGFLAFVPTQEYYSMPAYPAFAILIGAAMAKSLRPIRVIGAFAACAFLALITALWISRGIPAPGDIAQALTRHADAYTISLGHIGDLTIQSLAYLRLPLMLAALATLLGAIGTFVLRGQRAVFAVAIMMVLVFQAARVALIVFDPYLSSYPLAKALNQAPPGGLIVDDPYYEFSSLFYFAHRTGLILNGRANNLEYGSYASDAPHVFIDDAGFVTRWQSPDRWYVASEDEKARHLRNLVGAGALHAIATAGGKTVYVNQICCSTR
jgi:Dolichyl-phosphate-mannose-protein mannosyltransferase